MLNLSLIHIYGEIFVTEDGAETDLDLGHYERFIDQNLSKENNITTGKIYWSVIEGERSGRYRGQTVQVIPHITDEIKSRMQQIAQNQDIDVEMCIRDRSQGSGKARSFASLRMTGEVARVTFILGHPEGAARRISASIRCV